MFKFGKKETDSSTSTPKTSWLGQLRQGLQRSREEFAQNIRSILRGKKNIDKTLLEELETRLLMADVGIETSTDILNQLQSAVKRNTFDDADAIMRQLKEILTNILLPTEGFPSLDKKPSVVLMVGVNGAGKTTSIAKIANYYKQQGKSVMLAAGDTFRAAAIEQLQSWGERNKVPVIAQHSGADSAAVIYDALQSAKSKKIDLLIADTAGRLHTQDHLMNELAKIKRVMQKVEPEAPHETMLILDASMGQNALVQAKQFHKSIGLDSISLTKLDGTAKGGIVFAIANQLKLPYRFIGVGEKIDDLQPFIAEEFITALFN